ncbi:MAG TPA: hypothetical protein VF620_16590 [Allosphingosinicella sp.]|jgi:hypothetical protein
MSEGDDLTTIGAPPALDLVDLNKWLRKGEATYGPVIAIGIKSDGSATSATFKYQPGQPKKATIYLKADSGSAPATYTRVCAGEAFVSNDKEKVVIYRAP